MSEEARSVVAKVLAEGQVDGVLSGSMKDQTGTGREDRLLEHAVPVHAPGQQKRERLGKHFRVGLEIETVLVDVVALFIASEDRPPGLRPCEEGIRTVGKTLDACDLEPVLELGDVFR